MIIQNPQLPLLTAFAQQFGTEIDRLAAAEDMAQGPNFQLEYFHPSVNESPAIFASGLALYFAERAAQVELEKMLKGDQSSLFRGFIPSDLLEIDKTHSGPARLAFSEKAQAIALAEVQTESFRRLRAGWDFSVIPSLSRWKLKNL